MRSSIYLFILSSMSIVSFAQSGGTYQIEKSVVAAGGTSSGGGYSLTSTIAQPAAGRRQTGVRYQVNGGFWVPELAPTAANVSVSGRVRTAAGYGLVNAVVTITDTTGQPRTARTSSFGYYFFEDVPAGQSYVIGVTSKLHQFVAQIVTVDENVTDLDFTALP